MFDTLALAQQLAAGGVARDQAEVIAGAIGQGLEQGDHVTSDQFKAGLAEVRAEIANLDTRLSTQIAELRTEQGTQIAELRAELRTQVGELRTGQRTEIATVRTEIATVRTEIATVRTEIANLETRLIRWMVGTVIATAALTVGILRLLA